MENITILINTSDGFEDCWEPFFKLFKKYWPNCSFPILINTEFKSYSYDGLNINSSQVNLLFPNKKLTWSECLICALKKIDTPLVLYMQEDYFIENYVNNIEIEDFVKLMIEDKDISYIGLTNSGNYPPFQPTEKDRRLLKVSANAKYRISTQAAIWKKEVLESYLLPHENGWMFEIFGTKRSYKRNDLFLTINRDYYANKPIISYLLTGIIKSKWHQGIPEVFIKNGIQVDYNIRGFYKEKHVLVRKIETTRKLLRNPIIIFKSLFAK